MRLEEERAEQPLRADVVLLTRGEHEEEQRPPGDDERQQGAARDAVDG
jgi:hypothetical protein